MPYPVCHLHGTVKTGIHLQSAHLLSPHKELQSGQDFVMRTSEGRASLRQFLTVCVEIFGFSVVGTNCCISCPGGWLQTILQVIKAIVDLELVCGCGASYGSEIKILLTRNITGGLSCSQQANYMSLKMQHPWHCGYVQTGNSNLFFGISTLSWFLQFRRSCCSNPISKCLLHHLECDSQ